MLVASDFGGAPDAVRYSCRGMKAFGRYLRDADGEAPAGTQPPHDHGSDDTPNETLKLRYENNQRNYH